MHVITNNVLEKTVQIFTQKFFALNSVLLQLTSVTQVSGFAKTFTNY